MHIISKRHWASILFAALLAILGGSLALAVQDGEFKAVELDGFIQQEKQASDSGTKMIKMAAPISFTAKMKRYPEEQQMSYVYKAMELAGVSPLPEIGHRMFVESSGGRIIPVYVEKQTVAKIMTGLKEEGAARFLGYHIYSYSKGPAILVVDFVDPKAGGN
jgi:hypothetical protein